MILVPNYDTSAPEDREVEGIGDISIYQDDSGDWVARLGDTMARGDSRLRVIQSLMEKLEAMRQWLISLARPSAGSVIAGQVGARPVQGRVTL